MAVTYRFYFHYRKFDLLNFNLKPRSWLQFSLLFYPALSRRQRTSLAKKLTVVQLVDVFPNHSDTWSFMSSPSAPPFPCPHATSLVPTWQITVKLDISDLFQDLSENAKHVSGNLHEKPCVCFLLAITCNAMLNRTHCRISMATPSVITIFLTAMWYTKNTKRTHFCFSMTKMVPRNCRIVNWYVVCLSCHNVLFSTLMSAEYLFPSVL